MKGGSNSIAVSIAPAAIRTTTVTGAAVDLANFGENLFVFDPGTITDGTHTPKLQHSPDNNNDWVDCIPGTDQTGAGFTALASNVAQTASYLGGDRYVRQVVTVTGSPATGGYYDGFAVLGLKRKLP